MGVALRARARETNAPGGACMAYAGAWRPSLEGLKALKTPPKGELKATQGAQATHEAPSHTSPFPGWLRVQTLVGQAECDHHLSGLQAELTLNIA